MKLKNLLNIDKGSIISIVGAGGKTTLMFSLAEELRRESKVLVTTTTKIYVPEEYQYDYIAKSKCEFDYYNQLSCKGIYVYGNGINDQDKLVGLECDLLEKQVPHFDYALIEADGSRKKPIKGWGDHEPVIISKTNSTLGVFSIENIGRQVNENNVHRLKQFMNITNTCKGDIINIGHITNLVFHSEGLFKNAVGQKILFINKVKTESDIVLTRKLIDNIRKNNNGYLDGIIFGRLLN